MGAPVASAPERISRRIDLAVAALRAAVLAGIVEYGIRRVPLDRFSRWFGVPADFSAECPDLTVTLSDGPGGQNAPSLERRAVDGLYRRWPLGDTCLRRSLVLGRLLRDEHPRLRIGVARRNGSVIAHAWIETDRGTYYKDMMEGDQRDPDVSRYVALLAARRDAG